MKNMEAKFAAFDRRNPYIYQLFKKFALQAKRTGIAHYSGWAIMNRIRWHLDIETYDPDPDSAYKINNNYTAFYTRKLNKEMPRMRGFLRTRSSKNLSND